MRGLATDCVRGVTPSLKPEPAQWDPNKLTVSWLGHATTLINFYGTTILTDPVLFDRVGFNVAGTVIGRKRLVAAALQPDELPKIDLVLLSHAHMDHMDLPSLKALSTEASVMTASRTKDIFANETRFTAVTELKWGEKARLDDLEVEAFEVNHSGARWSSDSFRGYNGYILRKGDKQVVFGGDTALTGAFRSLASRRADLAIMPIGSYGRPGSSHCTPEQAVLMANEAKTSYFMPVHHKTFPIGLEPLEEPLERLMSCIEKERVVGEKIGSTFSMA